jgi:mRNA-degrading endonuclease RelE of RelBE toxin-antitoxin system
LGYEIRIIRSAEKELDNLPGKVYNRISKRFYPWGIIRALLVLKNSADEKNTDCGWVTTVFCTLLMIEIEPSPF